VLRATNQGNEHDATGLDYPPARITVTKGTAMAEEHWFDRVNKLLAHGAARRGVLGALALTYGQRLGATDALAKNGGKGGKKKERNKKKDKKKGKNGPARCGQETCARELPEDQFVACAEKCGRCRIRDQFCVIGPDAEHPVKHATCCSEHQQCCQDSLVCCDKTETCCAGRCCPAGSTCCGGFCCRTNNPYTTCCDGQCMNTEHSSAHCGACGNACGPDEFCRLGVCVLCGNECGGTGCPVGTELCSGRCRNTYSDPFHCGRCDNPCGPNERCDAGSCITECCVGDDGVTTCTEITGPNARNPYHCGGCNIKCPGNQGCIAGTCGCEGVGTIWCSSLQLCTYPLNCP
jgi:hypothetical protein